MSYFLKLVGEKIRKVRKEKKLTQEQLAELTEIQYTYIGGIERGERNISLQTLEKLAEGLAVAPYELLKFENISPLENNYGKETLIELNRNILLTRNEDEIKLLLKINEEILNYLDK